MGAGQLNFQMSLSMLFIIYWHARSSRARNNQDILTLSSNVLQKVPCNTCRMLINDRFIRCSDDQLDIAFKIVECLPSREDRYLYILDYETVIFCMNYIDQRSLANNDLGIFYRKFSILEIQQVITLS